MCIYIPGKFLVSSLLLRWTALQCSRGECCWGSGLAGEHLPSRSGLRWLLVVLDLDGVADLDGGAETFVIGIAHGHANVYGSCAEAQLVIGARVRREPVVAFDIFAERFKARENVFVALLDDVRNGFSIGLDDI